MIWKRCLVKNKITCSISGRTVSFSCTIDLAPSQQTRLGDLALQDRMSPKTLKVSCKAWRWLKVSKYIYIYQNHARNPFRDLLSYVVMSAHVRFIKIQSRYVPYCTDEKEWRRLILVCSDFPRHLPSSSIIFIFKACRNMTKQYSSGLTMPLLIVISEVLFNLGPSWRHECGAQHGPCCQCSCQGCQRTRCCCLTAADWQIWQLKKKGLNQLHRIMKIETVRLPLPCVSLAFRPSGQDWIAGFSRVNPKKPCG